MDAATGASPAYTPAQLLQFVEAGVFTKEEVREMVRKAMGCAASPVVTPKVTSPKVATPKVTTPASNSRQHINKRLVFAPAASPSVTKSRKRKAKDDPDSMLREIVRNTARRRFFKECCKRDSVLWNNRPNSDKQYMNRLLFKRAAEDVIDILHEAQPHQLRKTTDYKIEDIIRWQVSRDRNNWAGKTPKRDIFVGTVLPFDFDGENKKIQKQIEEAQDLTETPCNLPREEEVVQRLDKFINDVKIDVRAKNKPSTNACHTCLMDVWTAELEKCPPAIELAHPLGTDWGTDSNVQPYCAKCWEEELNMMTKLGQEHCAVGPKRK